MAVTALPTPPSRSDPATFAERGDAFMSALPTFQAEINALQITTNAQTAADAAASATSAAQAVVAKDAAIAAWAASMSPAETLPALSQSLHIGAVVKAIVYDTSKDSDGGAWRKRCADKSWYTETLGGSRWIGQHATISAAWTAAGSTTGAVYQASATAGAQTAGLYYTPTSSTTVTQVYRGVTREFPAVAGIVAESARVVIYDLATGAMWRVHVQTALASATDWWRSGRSATGLAAVNGKVSVSITTSLGGVIIADYAADKAIRHSITASGFVAPLTLVSSVGVSGALSNIVSDSANDVAITVLDSSPIDAATGLPVPTIAVATAGGVSVIKDDGTVVSSSQLERTDSVSITGSTLYMGNRFAVAGPSRHQELISIAAGWTPTNGMGYLASGGAEDQSFIASSGAYTYYRNGQAFFVTKFNKTTPNNSLRAKVTTAYNTGWLPGDIKGCYLADATAETVTASGELVTNGTFTTDTSGWTTGNSATFASSGSAGLLTNGAASNGYAYQAITTVVGKTYVVAASLTLGTAATPRLMAGTTVSGGELGVQQLTATGAFLLSFVATGTTTYITVITNSSTISQTATFDNISVKLAEPDRSVKNKGLVINGSLTKTAVASGAGLVAWSGFSAANYLEQPYNSDLDFGTGDFCVMGWVKVTSDVSCSFVQQTTSTGQSLNWGDKRWDLYYYATTDLIAFQASAGGASGQNVSTAHTLGNWTQVVVNYIAGTAYLYINGVLATSGAVSLATAGTYSKLALGGQTAGSTNGDYRSLALWRISATAPSADQIAHAYRTELPLFQANAQCTIAGSSAAVTALAFDDTSELLHVGTSWGRTGFKDLLRVDSEATTTGALTSLSASQGVIITGGTSGKVYVPAMLLRDELRRKDEARKALGKTPVFFDYTATASQTAFVAPKGYTIKAVYHNGTLKRETTTGVYWTRSNDGFAETATISVGATVSDWISLMCVRT